MFNPCCKFGALTTDNLNKWCDRWWIIERISTGQKYPAVKRMDTQIPKKFLLDSSISKPSQSVCPGSCRWTLQSSGFTLSEFPLLPFTKPSLEGKNTSITTMLSFCLHEKQIFVPKRLSISSNNIYYIFCSHHIQYYWFHQSESDWGCERENKRKTKTAHECSARRTVQRPQEWIAHRRLVSEKVAYAVGIIGEVTHPGTKKMYLRTSLQKARNCHISKPTITLTRSRKQGVETCTSQLNSLRMRVWSWKQMSSISCDQVQNGMNYIRE